MEDFIYCLFDAAGGVHTKDGAQSYAEVAATYGLHEDECDRYRFDVAGRRLVTERGNPASERAVRAYLDRFVGSPERLIAFAGEGRLSKHALAALLAIGCRRPYLDACAAIEKRYTEACTSDDPCLESGCALEDSICLQPLLRSEDEYRKACAAEWIAWFSNPSKRVDAWRTE